jgi:hypothetical protein
MVKVDRPIALLPPHRHALLGWLCDLLLRFSLDSLSRGKLLSKSRFACLRDDMLVDLLELDPGAHTSIAVSCLVLSCPALCCAAFVFVSCPPCCCLVVRSHTQLLHSTIPPSSLQANKHIAHQNITQDEHSLGLHQGRRQ